MSKMNAFAIVSLSNSLNWFTLNVTDRTLLQLHCFFEGIIWRKNFPGSEKFKMLERTDAKFQGNEHTCRCPLSLTS